MGLRGLVCLFIHLATDRRIIHRPALSLSAARHAVNGLGYWTGNGHLCVRLSVYGLLLCDTTNTRRRRLPGFMLESSRYRLPSKLFWLILFFSHRLLLPLLPNLLLKPSGRDLFCVQQTIWPAWWHMWASLG